MDTNTEAIEAMAEDEAADVEASGDGHGRRRVVAIANKDNAETIRLRVPLRATVQSVIEKMYAEFRLVQADDDRLTCRGNGEDVYQYGARSVAMYLEEGHCHALHWVFVGGTGGA